MFSLLIPALCFCSSLAVLNQQPRYQQARNTGPVPPRPMGGDALGFRTGSPSNALRKQLESAWNRPAGSPQQSSPWSQRPQAYGQPSRLAIDPPKFGGNPMMGPNPLYPILNQQPMMVPGAFQQSSFSSASSVSILQTVRPYCRLERHIGCPEKHWYMSSDCACPEQLGRNCDCASLRKAHRLPRSCCSGESMMQETILEYFDPSCNCMQKVSQQSSNPSCVCDQSGMFSRCQTNVQGSGPYASVNKNYVCQADCKNNPNCCGCQQSSAAGWSSFGSSSSSSSVFG